MPESPKKVRIVTLGCPKNEVDSEEIAGVLGQSGFVVDGTTKSPDLTIINTCGFLDSAKQESLDVIRKAIRTKGKGKIIVAGCLVQRLGEELKQLTQGADGYVGVGQMAEFGGIASSVLGAGQLESLQPPQHKWATVGTRARSGSPWSAYLKVSEGCDHRCTFCTIPSFRGPHASKPIERVLAEARSLVAGGARELNLIAQDVTQYGYDLYKEFMLPKLLAELNAVEGVDWLRILYCYPNRLTDELIDAIAGLDKVVKYIDVPLQHTHPDVLRRMKRPWDGERYLWLVEKLRAAMPDVAIRTTFIVGFPGETEAEFAHMVSWVKQAGLDRVGAFLFSREPGTPSHEMPDQVPFKVKRARLDKLMRTQQAISLERNRAWVGRSLQVLVERVDGEWLVGRSHRDAPEIDGLVYVKGSAAPGSFVLARVVEGQEYDLVATLGDEVAGPHRSARKPAAPL